MIDRSLTTFRREIFESSESRFLALVFTATILLNGLWLSPAADRMLRLARDPFSNPFGNKNDWLLENYLLPFAAHVAGATSSMPVYAGFCLLLLVLSLGQVYVLVRRHHGRDLARTFLVVFAVAPVSLVVLGGLGYSDTVTIVFGSALALLWSRTWLIVALAVLMGLNHWSQGVVIIVVAAFGHASSPESQPRRLVIRTTGYLLCVAAGLALLRWIFNRNGIEPTYDRLDYFLDRGTLHFVRVTSHSLGLLLYSTFGCLWFGVYRVSVSTKRVGGWFLMAGFGVALAITLLTLDQTRVFTLLSWPLVLIAGMQFVMDGEGLSLSGDGRRFTAILLLFGLLMPKVAVWNGRPYGSHFYHDVYVLIEGVRDPGSLRWEENRWIADGFN